MDPRDDLVLHYRWLRKYGCNDSHSGNGSVRHGEEFWVTPSGACADLLRPADLVKCHVNGRLGEGASLDAELHRQIYHRNAETMAVLHSHGPYTVGMTLNGKDFVPSDFEGYYYFQQVPVLSVPFEKYIEEAPERVAEALSHSRITIVRGHGVYACAPTLNLAYKWTCSLELSAKTAFIAQQAGTLPKW